MARRAKIEKSMPAAAARAKIHDFFGHSLLYAQSK